MRVFSALCAILCSIAVEAAPREPRHHNFGRSSLRRTRIPNFEEQTVPTNGGNTYVSYTENWAGAALAGTGFTSATGTFVATTVKNPSGSNSNTQYCIANWVGIDGRPCDRVILQAGVDSCIQGSKTTFSAWYEWYPDYSHRFSITVNEGDSIRITTNASSTSSGVAVIENLTTGKSVSQTFTAQSVKLCQTGVEWIVEDFFTGGSGNNGLVPLANFGDVTFTNASAVKGGKTIDLTGAEIIDIKQNNKIWTNCSTPSSSSMHCSYVQ